MADLSELYEEVVLDHYRDPRNYGKPKSANRQAEGYNPLCGDRVTIYLDIEGDTIRDIGFEGSGCAISTAAVSLMTERLKGKTKAEAEALAERMHRMLTGEKDNQEAGPDLGKLAVLEGVVKFPNRVKCASLGWHAVLAAIRGAGKPVTTE